MDKIPLNHKLNKEACDKFIKNADVSVKDICEKIIENTMYVSYENFVKTLNIIINEYIELTENLHFYNNYRPIFIYNPVNKKNVDEYNILKYKSNYWIYKYVYKYLQKIIDEYNNSSGSKKTKLIEINNLSNTSQLKPNDFILIIDDCIFSGGQTNQTFLKLLNTSENPDNYYFYMLIPFGSNNAKKMITLRYDNMIDYLKKRKRQSSYSKVIFPTNMKEIKSIKSVLTIDECNLLRSFYNSQLFDINTYLIYFDHKLADYASVPTIFYLGVVPNNYNKNLIKDLNNSQFKQISKQLQIIPIIHNCENYLENLDIMEPLCPFTPYKKNFLTNIRHLLKKNNSSNKRKIIKNYHSY